jgi:hypothetical protein
MIGIPNAATKRDYNLNMLGTNHHSFSDLEDEDTSKEDDNEPNVAVDDIIDDIADTDTPNKNNTVSKKKKKEKKTTNLANETNVITSCAEAYFSGGNDKAILVAMAIGLDDPVIDTDDEPYKSSRSRSSFVPSANHLYTGVLFHLVMRL